MGGSTPVPWRHCTDLAGRPNVSTIETGEDEAGGDVEDHREG